MQSSLARLWPPAGSNLRGRCPLDTSATAFMAWLIQTYAGAAAHWRAILLVLAGSLVALGPLPLIRSKPRPRWDFASCADGRLASTLVRLDLTPDLTMCEHGKQAGATDNVAEKGGKDQFARGV
jgi:hypothetical protein